jgi:hypothetical protein
MDVDASIDVPRSAGIAMDVLGLLAIVLSFTPGLHQHWVTIWLIAAAVAAGLGSSLMGRPASLSELAFTLTP